MFKTHTRRCLVGEVNLLDYTAFRVGRHHLFFQNRDRVAKLQVQKVFVQKKKKLCLLDAAVSSTAGLHVKREI